MNEHLLISFSNASWFTRRKERERWRFQLWYSGWVPRFWQPFWISHIAAHEKRWNFIVWKTKSQTFQNNFPGNILVIPWNNIPKWNLARFRLIRNRQSLFKQVCDKNFLLTKLTCESRCLYLVLICWPRDRVYWQGSQNRIAKI